jgi:transcriptional regulator with XRE-family HTH domain
MENSTRFFFGSTHNPNTLGQYLKNKRSEEGLTLRQLEAITGINQGSLSHIERGQFRSPSVYNVTKLAKYLELSPLEVAKMIDIPNEEIQRFIKDEEEMKP